MYKLKQNNISEKLFDIITEFLNFRKQRVFLNGQYYSWTSIEDGIPQGSMVEPLLFLMYINDLPHDLKTTGNLFTDDSSLFSAVHNMNTSAFNSDTELNKIRNDTIQWKMDFNPDPSKQAQKTSHNPVYYSRYTVQ